MAAAALTVAVPTQPLLELARRFKNDDFLATHSQEVKTDSATNHTATQVMNLVSDLNKMFKDVAGMSTVAKEIANCISPLIRRAATPQEDDDLAVVIQLSSHDVKVLEASDNKVMDEISESAQQTRNKFNKAGTLKDDDDMAALFQLTPDDLKVLEASDNKVIDETIDSAQQMRNKVNESERIPNSATIFYMMTVLVRYSPKRQTFDLYYAYVNCRDTSIWNWVLSGAEKKQRKAALEVEGMYLLGTELARQSNNTVQAIPDLKAYEDLQKVLES